MVYNHDQIKDFIEAQLQIWPLAKKNFDGLASIERKSVEVNGYELYVQYNPTRMVSTGASVDKVSIASRKCFLCKGNRPQEQLSIDILPGWELLVNPYPIFSAHLTIASKDHIPQKAVPYDIITLSLGLPEMAVFFNGANAGASAPDHLHLQAVLKDELPLLRLAERIHPESVCGVFPSDALTSGYPFFFFTGVIEPDERGMKTMLAGLSIGGSSDAKTIDDHALVNTFFWLGKEGKLRFVAVPRRAHRPLCYYAEGKEKILVSPGSIDMAGVIITPRREDFDNITISDIREIYREVGFLSKN